MKDFFNGCEPTISALIQGKVVDKFVIGEAPTYGNRMLVIQFADGTELVFEYDWIYEWDVRRQGVDENK